MILVMLAACAAPTPKPGTTVSAREGVVMTTVATGLEQVTDIQFAMGRMVVTTQSGRLAWVDGGTVKTWQDVEVIDRSERGLLGLAFHPDYANNGKLVLSWTEAQHSGAISKIGLWTTTPGSKPGDAPLTQGAVLFEQKQPWSNHNGGGIQFGPDGMLYFGLGDGGKADDPLGSGQDGQTALGSMLRLDVDAPAPYIPTDNPFVKDPSMHDAIWAWGLRNPWRFSFAPDGRLVVADVGQNKWEELDFVPKGGNMGWNAKEGRACFAKTPCEGEYVDPFWVYGRDQGGSITGGYVATSGKLAGKYLFGDFASQRIWAAVLPKGDADLDAVEVISESQLHPSTFGRDTDGRIYVGDYSKGVIYRLD